MWSKLGVIATVGSIIFGLLGAVCDMKDVKDKINDIKSAK